MRTLWVATLAAVIALSVFASTPVTGQQQPLWAMPRQYGTPPPLVVTAFGGEPITYTAPRTPWGDPDLQGVWSSDDMEGVGIAAGGGRGRGAAAAPPADPAAPPPPLYLTPEQFEARRKQVATSAQSRDQNSIGTFRNDYARRAFPQTRLLIDPPNGRMPPVYPSAERTMPRGTNGTGPLDSWLDFPLYERCITRGIGGSVLRVIYGNGNRIVQGPGVVAFSYEMLPDTRIFPIDNSPHVSDKISMYLGTSPLPLPPSPPQIGAWAVLHEIRSEYAQIMCALYLLIAGPGPWSVDAILARARARRTTRTPGTLLRTRPSVEDALSAQVPRT